MCLMLLLSQLGLSMEVSLERLSRAGSASFLYLLLQLYIILSLARKLFDFQGMKNHLLACLGSFLG